MHDLAKDLRGISKALQTRVIESRRVYQNIKIALVVCLLVYLFKFNLFGPIRSKSVWCCVHDFAKDLRGISKALQARVIYLESRSETGCKNVTGSLQVPRQSQRVFD